MTEVKNLKDAEDRGLKIYERTVPLTDFIERFNLDRANPPTCANKNPGDVCFRGNCDADNQRLVMFCDESKGCGGKYTYEPC